MDDAKKNAQKTQFKQEGCTRISYRYTKITRLPQAVAGISLHHERSTTHAKQLNPCEMHVQMMSLQNYPNACQLSPCLSYIKSSNTADISIGVPNKGEKPSRQFHKKIKYTHAVEKCRQITLTSAIGKKLQTMITKRQSLLLAENYHHSP